MVGAEPCCNPPKAFRIQAAMLDDLAGVRRALDRTASCAYVARGPKISVFPLVKRVGVTGFEPATSSV
jgi:hypothetical protein